MTTKRELEQLALKAFGGSAPSVECDGANVTSTAYANGRHVSVHAPTIEEEREMLAAALRGIIRWKEVQCKGTSDGGVDEAADRRRA